jgi:hypothetical protein
VSALALLSCWCSSVPARRLAGRCGWQCGENGDVYIMDEHDGVAVLGGVGMPASLFLDEFGSQVWAAFGHCCYHVGSSLLSKQWRDVDVRLILNDEEYERMGLGDPVRTHANGKWVSLVLAYSALGKAMTGLPIDFQIQQQSYANEHYKGPRSVLGMTSLRLARYTKGSEE